MSPKSMKDMAPAMKVSVRRNGEQQEEAASNMFISL